MSRWTPLILLILVALLCLTAGLLVGFGLPPLLSERPSAPGLSEVPLASPPVPTPDNDLRLVVFLVDDLSLGSQSHLMMAWAGEVLKEGGPLQVTLHALPPDLLQRAAGMPLLLTEGHVNPQVLRALFSSSELHYVVLDLPRLWELLDQIEQSTPGGPCGAQDCAEWLYGPGVDESTRWKRFQQLSWNVLSWAAQDPKDHAAALEKWMTDAQVRGWAKSDLPPTLWADLYNEALVRGMQVVP